MSDDTTTYERMYELGQLLRAARGVAIRQGFTEDEILSGFIGVSAAEAALQHVDDAELRARIETAYGLARAEKQKGLN